MATKSAFERIHQIHPTFNRLFSVPIYLVSTAVVLLVFISPYRVRIGIAFLINFLMNRPHVYLSVLSRKVARPINRVVVLLFYFTVFGIYAALLRRRRGAGSWRASTESSTWQAPPEPETAESLLYQS